MLQTLFAKVGLPALVRLLGRVLSRSDDTADLGEKLLSIDPQVLDSKDRAKLLLAEIDKDVELRRFDSDDLREVNRTYRAELATRDPYVRRWRPTFGYLLSVAFLAQVFGGIGVAVFLPPDRLPPYIEFVKSTTPMWTPALAVLGISVWRRSDDKTNQLRSDLGVRPTGILDLFNRR